MGATLEQFDLTHEDYGGLQGKCHEALVLNRPDVIEGVHNSMLDAGAEVLETDTFQASRLKLDEWGLAEHTRRDQRQGGRDRPQGRRRAPLRGRLDRPDRLPARLRRSRRWARSASASWSRSSPSRPQGLIEGGADLLLIETAQDILEVKAAVFGAARAFRATGTHAADPDPGLAAAQRRQDAARHRHLGRAGHAGGAAACRPSGSTARPAPRTCATRSASSASSRPLPVSCIPNAGLPLQGPDGETIFPEEPEPLADALQEFVERYGVSIVGGCCGTTPEHIRAIAERVAGREVGPRPAPRPPHISSMIAATPLVQEPRPTMVGERVNSQGSRKAKELLLADDYDGLVQIAEDQVDGGAHVLDVCVALTERQDEDEQMRQVVKRVSLTQESPIQVDSTEPEVIKVALEQIPGRAIVNSVNLEAGRDKLDRVVPLALEHGAAVIALTIDEVGMAKTAERKVEIAQRIHDSPAASTASTPRR